MADMALAMVEDFESGKLDWLLGGMDKAEGFEKGYIDELGFELLGPRDLRPTTPTAPAMTKEGLASMTNNVTATPQKTPEQVGWQRPSDKVNERIIAAVSGLPKGGKSHLALTAPAPIFYHDFDEGLEGTIEQFVRSGKEIYTARYRMPAKSSTPDEKQKEAELISERYQTMFYDSVRRGEGTVVIDTHTEEWEIRRLAAFGKLTQVMPTQYAQVNNAFRADIREAYESGMNVILLQKLKKEYTGNSWNGKYEPGGYTDLPYLVQCNIEAYRDPNDGEFKAYVKDCRQNMNLAGTVLEGPMCDFEMLLMQVFA